MMNIRHLLFLFLAFLFSGTALAAEKTTIIHEDQYKACMILAKTKPEDAFESAIAWRDLGGGDAAKHCAAISLINLKHYKDGAERLEKLAEETNSSKEFKAALLAQAGQAWLLADNSDKALSAQSTGLKLHPRSLDLLIDRAQTFAEKNLFFEAIDDLNRALEIEANLTDALVFRATSYRFVDSLEMATQDLEQALKIDPEHPEALLEKGIVERLKGDKNQARTTWMTLLEVSPGSPAAEAARANLEAMDVDKEK